MYVAAGVSVILRGRRILDRVDLTVRPGEVTALVGPNGAGKSTLLKVIAGALRPKDGQVTLHGTDIATLSPGDLAARRAVLSQSVELAFPFAVDDVVRFGVAPGIGPAEADRLAGRALQLVDLGGLERRPCTTLSGGEQQRVHLARVLVQLWAGRRNHAGYLLLDEPTAGLDLAHQLQALDIARVHAAAGGGVLAILHDLNLAATADRVVVLDGGRIVADGSPAEVVTDRLLAEVYRVGLWVNAVPAGVFVLPQAAGGQS